MEKAVYTLHLQNGKHYGKNFSGFSSEIDLARFLTLSVLYAKKQFPKVELFADEEAATFADFWNIPFTEIHHQPAPKDLNPAFWAYPKIQTYAAQTRPFIHIDCDVILWEKLSHKHLSAPLLFQNKEEFNSHSGYYESIKYLKENFKGKENLLFPDYAFNCGIVGANDLETIQLWKQNVDSFLFGKEGAQFWSKPETLSLGWNHFFEQAFIAAIANHKKVEADFLIPGFVYENIKAPSFKITHLWGHSKQRPDLMERISARLQNEFSQQAEKINSAANSHARAFTQIYKNNSWTFGSGAGSLPSETAPFRKFLQKFLKQHKIKSITDLGCGDMQFMKLLDFTGIKYTGLDCVSSIITANKKAHPGKTFTLADIKTAKIPTTDLLIIKDVFIHWKNEEVKKFLARKIKAKFILIVNDTLTTLENSDIQKPGEFRQIDITKPPFNVLAEKVFTYNNKTVFLIQ